MCTKKIEKWDFPSYFSHFLHLSPPNSFPIIWLALLAPLLFFLQNLPRCLKLPCEVSGFRSGEVGNWAAGLGMAEEEDECKKPVECSNASFPVFRFTCLLASSVCCSYEPVTHFGAYCLNAASEQTTSVLLHHEQAPERKQIQKRSQTGPCMRSTPPSSDWALLLLALLGGHIF